MKYFLLLFTIILTVSAAVNAQEMSLGLTLFTEKKTAADQCIQVRRGDRIELTGEISREPDSKELVFRSIGGREYLLKGDLTLELLSQIKAAENTISITVEGIILFEGLEERPAELEITSYTKQ